jgi:hypothetical protein
MSPITIAFTFFTATALVAAEPRCYQVGRTLHGMDLPANCVHGTHDYSVSFEVDNGCVNFFVPDEFDHVPGLELYTGERMLTQWEDCCPPETFTYHLDCEHVPVEGECCYSEDAVHVSGLNDDLVRCVHDVENYTSFVPEEGSAWWNTTNPEANTHVELYGSLHSNGCCEKFLYAIECSPCAA